MDNAQKLEPNSPETLLALGYYQYYVLRDYGLAKTTFGSLAKCYRVAARSHMPLAELPDARDNWDESVAYFEQALTLEPRNVELLMEFGRDLRHSFDNSPRR